VAQDAVIVMTVPRMRDFKAAIAAAFLRIRWRPMHAAGWEMPNRSGFVGMNGELMSPGHARSDPRTDQASSHRLFFNLRQRSILPDLAWILPMNELFFDAS
jgi:hypothetical protein